MTSTTNGGHSESAVLTGHAPPAISTFVLGLWTRRALCADADPEIFFPAHDDPATEARQICARCPVRINCLQFALHSHEPYGIWGGLEPGEQASLRRKIRQSVPHPGERGAA